MTRAVRMYQIIYAAQDELKPEDVQPPMNEEERKLFDLVAKDVAERKEKGIPEPMYEIPFDAYDDEDGIEDIYPDDFDAKVVKELEEEK